MTDLELIFSMLGEAATTEIARTRDTQGFPESTLRHQAIATLIPCPQKKRARRSIA
jgi:hypothetical protein